MRKIKLSQCGSYVTKERINSNKLNVNNYITTDNMLPNKEGICDAEKIPTNITVNHFQENDILLSNIRPYFKKIWKAEYEGGCSADVLIFRTNCGYNADFIRYCLSQDAFFDYDMKGAKGSKMPRGDKNHILNFELYDFSLPSQTSIASVLKVLDNKIILNNKINNELEQMAKTLYDYWFVQFDFPDEKGRPYKSANGKMVYNEVLKREIPEGWEVGTFASYIKQDKGGDWGKDECAGNYIKKVYCIRGADFPSLTGHSSCKAPIRFILNKNSSKILSSGDLVIEISGGSPTQSTGRIGYINQHVLERFDDDVITSNFCKALSLNNKNTLYNFYLEWERLYKSGLFFNYEGKTTGIKNLLFDTFVESYKIAIPPQNIINAFYDTVRNIFEKIQCNAKENHYLETIRDFLLPLLMNGQVTVSPEH